MIQRIQSLYLLASILLLSSLLSGVTVLSFVSGETNSKFNVFGLFWRSKNEEIYKPDLSFPFYIILIFLLLIQLATLLNYKKLKTQLKWAQYGFLIYVVLGLALLIFFLAGSDLALPASTATPGFGLFLFLAGIPFTFLAVKAIKKDKALIDSVDRIR
jgi:hypothetical protein